MFYKAENIENLLMCPKCCSKLDDPRVLPCGQTCCHKCIQDLLKNSTADLLFRCPLCKSKHFTANQTDPFPKNMALQALLAQTSGHVSRGELHDTLKRSLDEMEKKVYELERNHFRSAESVDEYCVGLRNQVDLSAEMHIVAIQNRRDELLSAVNNYGSEMVRNIHENESEKQKYTQAIEDTKSLFNKWSNYIRGFETDDNEIKTAISECQEKINLVDSHLREHESFVLSQNPMKFQEKKPQNSEDLIGDLERN